MTDPLGEASRATALVVVSGREKGKWFALHGDELSVGRAPTCEVCVEDEGIARRHARLLRDGDRWVIEDARSANGTFVNGERADRRVLVDGDAVQIGSSAVLKFSTLDAIDEKLLREQLDAARRDSLTQAFNKKYFADQLKADFAFAHRHRQPLSLALFDIDDFKTLNDGYGHMAGDFVLKTLSALVQKALRTEDIFARYGGEEFGIILRNTDGERAFLLCERIRRSLEDYQFMYEGKRLPVTISMGIATLQGQNFPTPKALVKAADELLYSAKHKGRNRTESALMGS